MRMLNIYQNFEGRKEHGENANMVEANIEIKVEVEFPAGINVVKEIEGESDDVPKEESSSACGKDMYECEEGTNEGTDEVTGNKDIKEVNANR